MKKLSLHSSKGKDKDKDKKSKQIDYYDNPKRKSYIDDFDDDDPFFKASMTTSNSLKTSKNGPKLPPIVAPVLMNNSPQLRKEEKTEEKKYSLTSTVQTNDDVHKKSKHSKSKSSSSSKSKHSDKHSEKSKHTEKHHKHSDKEKKSDKSIETSTDISSEVKEKETISEKQIEKKEKQKEKMKEKEKEEEIVIEDFEELERINLTKYTEIHPPKTLFDDLKTLHGKEGNYNIIFNSEIDCFDSRTLHSMIRLKSDLFFLCVTTDNCVFGSYHHKIPPRGEWLRSDKRHYLFTLMNFSDYHPVKFKWNRKLPKVLYFGSDDNSDNMICIVSNVFSIWKTGSYIIDDVTNFGKMYEDPENYGPKIFTGSVFPNKFQLKQLIKQLNKRKK